MDSLYNRIGAGFQKNENVFVVIKWHALSISTVPSAEEEPVWRRDRYFTKSNEL
jgi:hypothetical protein